MSELFNKIFYIDDPILERKIDFIKHIDKLFKVKLFIVNNDDQYNIVDKILMTDMRSGIILNGLNNLEKNFDLETIFGGELLDIPKLVVFYCFNDDINKSKTFNNLILFKNRLNITIQILTFDNDNDDGNIFKNILKFTELLLFKKYDDEEVTDVYYNYFKVYPPIDVFKKKIKLMEKNNYLVYLKNADRYVTTDNRFSILDIPSNENNDANNDDDTIIIVI